jgi:hypothetical protein
MSDPTQPSVQSNQACDAQIEVPKASSLRNQHLNDLKRHGPLCKLVPGPRLVVHLIPWEVAVEGLGVDISEQLAAAPEWAPIGLPVLGCLNQQDAAFKDGHMQAKWPRAEEDPVLAYSRLFANGTLEAVCAVPYGPGAETLARLEAEGFKEALLRLVHQFRDVLREFSLEPRPWVGVSLLSAKSAGLVVETGPTPFNESRRPSMFQQDTVMLDGAMAPVAPAAIGQWDRRAIQEALEPVFHELRLNTDWADQKD